MLYIFDRVNGKFYGLFNLNIDAKKILLKYYRLNCIVYRVSDNKIYSTIKIHSNSKLKPKFQLFFATIWMDESEV